MGEDRSAKLGESEKLAPVDGNTMSEMQEGSGMTLSLLAFLRRHSWTGPDLIFVTVGIRSVAASKFPYLPFWAGIACFLCALTLIWATERFNRAQQAKS
jgi:hypothetical protein